MKKLFFFFIWLFLVIPCQAGIITVNSDGSGDYPTIQAAIDAAVDGDEVAVADGIYTGENNRDIDFGGRAITVKSENGPENCIIDCQNSGRGFIFQSDENSTSVLEGFTIKNAYYSKGGAIYCTRTSPMIKYCIFSKNTAYEGGAVFSAYGNPTLINCLFAENTARFGGGIIVKAVYSSAIGATLINCTIVKNHASNHVGYAGGVDISSSGRLSLTNCILWGNTNIYGDNLYAQIRKRRHIVNYSCIKDLGDGYGGFMNITGCTEQNPLFVSEDHYWLQPDSPCIDAGDPDYVAGPNETDLDDRPRIINGRIDMGAYEYNPQIEVAMRFTPQALNPFSKGKWLKAHFVLPECYMVEDVDVDTPAFVESCNIQSAYIDAFINEDSLVEIVAYFDRRTFCGIGYGETIDIKVVGSFTDGKQFYGIDTVKITNNYLKSLAILSSHWLENCGNPDYCDGVDLNEDSVVNFKDFSMMLDGCWLLH